VQAPDAVFVGSARGAGEEDVEGGEFRRGVRDGGIEEVVWWEAGCVEGAVVGCQTAEGFGVLRSLVGWIVI
jgi:hypothetical protein